MEQHFQCLWLRGLDGLNETFKAVCLNSIENILSFLEGPQSFTKTQHVKISR